MYCSTLLHSRMRSGLCPHLYVRNIYKQRKSVVVSRQYKHELNLRFPIDDSRFFSTSVPRCNAQTQHGIGNDATKTKFLFKSPGLKKLYRRHFYFLYSIYNTHYKANHHYNNTDPHQRNHGECVNL
jgi:hypothetical protein